jgi:hypothetical protein
MILTKNDLFQLTSPKGMFTPDSITEVISWDGKKSTVYTKKIEGGFIQSGSLARLEELVNAHQPSSNEGARHDYGNGHAFNND